MKAIFLRLWVWVTGSSVAAFELIAPLVASATAELLVSIEPIVINAVLASAIPRASGADKRALAFDQIRAQTIAKGIAVSANIINTGIELAVDKLKAQGKLP